MRDWVEYELIMDISDSEGVDRSVELKKLVEEARETERRMKELVKKSEQTVLTKEEESELEQLFQEGTVGTGRKLSRILNRN